MKFGIVGGGPAGLYLAILLKRADPDHDVALVERNPPDATFGWGVVFSEDTLKELRDADYETFVDIDEALVRWDAIDIRYRGRVIRSHGHGFSAISRIELLRLLQERARDLGVDLSFRREATSVDVFDDHDVVVAADGVHSTLRDRREEVLGTTRQAHRSRYVWFGTDLAFEVFTFIFEETEYGLFTVHAYPFDADTSTFIVECMPDTWRAAGLDRMSESESLAFCQELFSDHLDGHKLMSNKSVWTRFVTVRNESWHDSNVVLAGDAAHTAHFSIGSGTKLAMEDAIALQKAFVEHGDDIQAAFTAYELERQIPVERFQDAAVDSSRYFETVSRYIGFDHAPFAFNLLTRSGRITHLNLEMRDPTIVNVADRRFAQAATGDAREWRRIVTGPPMLQPLELRDVELHNRVVLAPAPLDAADDGRVGALHAAALGAAADAGAGLVVTEMTGVSPEARATPASAGLWSDEHAAAWEDLLQRVRGDGGVKVAVRLGHAGPRGATRPRGRGLDRPLPDGGWPLVAASRMRYLPHSPQAEALDAGRREGIRADFAAAAGLAAGAGFDLCVVDCSDGYLLATFLSPLTNDRDDEFGGDLDARMRFPLEVVDAVRAEWPQDRPLVVRLNCDDRRPGGVTPQMAVAMARGFAAHGVDAVDVVAGHSVPWGTAAADYRRNYRVELATTVRNEAPVPVVASGNITRVDDVNTVLAAGRADLVVLDPVPYYARDPIRSRP